MFSRRIITVLTTAAAIGLAAVGLAGPAAARAVQTGDEMFLAQMRSLGVSFPSPQEAVREGHQVCAELSAGKTPTAVTVAVFRQTNLTPPQAAGLVTAATQAYCPQFSGQPA
ncbi:DUF732 domain-containing protein [Mycobacterium avium]|uniref:DUF732 domain-containing protein n=1 Tax=Mycobacterium avium TaxID=1764 RepID=UPI0001B59F5E|nr:DUF732 domain-containing protein [Mycobacterium avium]ETB11681.1 hypothetical protein P863_08165 [Mycobacterium avium subsp. silvaticum ATCC 49884]ETB18570.1 hypothetical protein O972_07160 [Mycobacterium avium subsp. avium 10-9275]ETB22475.1 hypothetical protein O973_07075 [Mycobacterium avium subsp. avium 11-4751]ANR90159.1 hypothetical protein BBJ32_01965 [Mycobacterium avium]AYJ05856.1 DUF732 domain-containing protein [Mycobacterium avium]